jgi:hypothetical protein
MPVDISIWCNISSSRYLWDSGTFFDQAAVMSARVQRDPGQARATTRGLRWHLILLTALLSFAWQGFLTQTHVHFVRGVAVEQGSTRGPSTADPTRSPHSLPADCPVCSAAAYAGTYLPPAPIILLAPDHASPQLAATIWSGSDLRHRSHAWRSRAPPHQLQA